VRKLRVSRHRVEAVVPLVERLVDGVDPAGQHCPRAALAHVVDRRDDGGKAGGFLVADGDVRATQLEFQPGETRR
jgi:hypothetical protein